MCVAFYSICCTFRGKLMPLLIGLYQGQQKILCPPVDINVNKQVNVSH